jgi:hypothetical protein
VIAWDDASLVALLASLCHGAGVSSGASEPSQKAPAPQAKEPRSPSPCCQSFLASGDGRRGNVDTLGTGATGATGAPSPCPGSRVAGVSPLVSGPLPGGFPASDRRALSGAATAAQRWSGSRSQGFAAANARVSGRAQGKSAWAGVAARTLTSSRTQRTGDGNDDLQNISKEA